MFITQAGPGGAAAAAAAQPPPLPPPGLSQEDVTLLQEKGGGLGVGAAAAAAVEAAAGGMAVPSGAALTARKQGALHFLAGGHWFHPSGTHATACPLFLAGAHTPKRCLLQPPSTPAPHAR